MVLPFWCRLNQVVLEKMLLNECLSVCLVVIIVTDDLCAGGLFEVTDHQPVWPGGNGVTYVSIDTLHGARFVLRSVTVRGYTVLICNRPSQPTQPPSLMGIGTVR